MMLDGRVVHVVDDDPAMREAIDNLLSSHGFRVRTYDSASAYVGAEKPDLPACLVLDVELPDMTGLGLQTSLEAAGPAAAHPPIVFITGHGTISASVRAMKGGAVDFLPKPFGQDALLQAVETALARDSERRAATAAHQKMRELYASLTPRERDVLPLVAAGLMNKQAAEKLGISLVTLQIHRGNVMRKMGAGSLAELVRMAARLGIGGPVQGQ